jgi:PIN domain nuclease of toxin-antitoxin system
LKRKVAIGFGLDNRNDPGIMTMSCWIAKSESLPFIHFVPVTNSIAVKSVNLPLPLHPDPADRIIIATALWLGAPLVTKDKKLLDYCHINTIW